MTGVPEEELSSSGPSFFQGIELSINASTIVSGESPSVGSPVSILTLISVIPLGGLGVSTGVFLKALSIKEIQMGSAARAPVSFFPKEVLSSKPTQTPARREGVYPTNQASE